MTTPYVWLITDDIYHPLVAYTTKYETSFWLKARADDDREYVVWRFSPNKPMEPVRLDPATLEPTEWARQVTA